MNPRPQHLIHPYNARGSLFVCFSVRQKSSTGKVNLTYILSSVFSAKKHAGSLKKFTAAQRAGICTSKIVTPRWKLEKNTECRFNQLTQGISLLIFNKAFNEAYPEISAGKVVYQRAKVSCLTYSLGLKMLN